MIKTTALISAIITAFASYGEYDYSRENQMFEFSFFGYIVLIVIIVIDIVIFVRWWTMTSDVKEIKEYLTHNQSMSYLLATGQIDFSYLVATGDIEQANKAAIVMLVDKLMSIYDNKYDYNKAFSMDKYLNSNLPKLEKYGLTIPEYMKSGEKFIDYINGLTGNKVPYDG